MQDSHLDVVLGDGMRETLGLSARCLCIAALQRLPHILATCTPQRHTALGAPVYQSTTVEEVPKKGPYKSFNASVCHLDLVHLMVQAAVLWC